MSKTSINLLPNRQAGVLFEGDLEPQILNGLGREFTSKSGVDFVSIKGSREDFIVQPSQIAACSLDYPGSWVNQQGTPAQPGETYWPGNMQIGVNSGVLYATEAAEA